MVIGRSGKAERSSISIIDEGRSLTDFTGIIMDTELHAGMTQWEHRFHFYSTPENDNHKLQSSDTTRHAGLAQWERRFHFHSTPVHDNHKLQSSDVGSCGVAAECSTRNQEVPDGSPRRIDAMGAQISFQLYPRETII
ncbi:hypothetical protein Bbelb_248880 [Branchiostoma belcheri]|nr:hypothetical protein Bbelb_248880 [Branchiostoma belcheri]